MSELDDALELGRAVQQLRLAYEQYFAGVERLEPQKERERLKRELRRLMGSRSNNTAYKFRLQTTQATFLTLETYWDRITRQIEEGTFKRDKLKAARRSQVLADASEDVELVDDAEEVDAYEELDASDALAQLEADDGESAIAELLSKGLIGGAGGTTPRSPASPTAVLEASSRIGVASTAGSAAANPTRAPGLGSLSMTPAASAAAVPRSTAAPADNVTAAPRAATTPTPNTAAEPRPSAAPTSNATAAPRSPTPPTSNAAAAPRSSATPTPNAAAPRSSATPTPNAAAPSATTTSDARALGSAGPDPEFKKLHDAFAAARAQTGERAVSLDALAETIRKQSAAVKAQLGCERVEFKVAIKDGKAVLKAVPK